MKIINCGMEMYFTMAPYAHVNIITEKKSSIDFENNIAEFGRLLIGNTIFRGKNIAFRATKLLCEYGFSKLNLNKIFIYNLIYI